MKMFFGVFLVVYYLKHTVKKKEDEEVFKK